MLNSDIFVLHVKRFMSAYLQLTYIRAPDCGLGKKYGQQIVTQTRLRPYPDQTSSLKKISQDCCYALC